MDLAVIALTFGAIFVVELPDKTFIATLVLSTKFRPLLVWIGVGLAFAVQTLVGVALGKVAGLLPDTLVHVATAAMFLVGAAILLRTAGSADEDEVESESEYAAKVSNTTTGVATAVMTSFLVLFAAEWGDLSQLLTLSLVAKYDSPVSVFVGAFGALLAVSGLAVLIGRSLLNWVSLKWLHRVGGSVCLVLAGITLWELLR
jgi:putative Ca2+/H+ antiporter (TMEM165/GDT1 family)